MVFWDLEVEFLETLKKQVVEKFLLLPPASENVTSLVLEA